MAVKLLFSIICRFELYTDQHFVGRGRCFHFWQEFNKCYATADAPQQCLDQRDDYLECLHHTKEVGIAKIKKSWEREKESNTDII